MQRLGERAVVVGASMAGLLAARVLGETFDEVVLVERDPLPDGPAHRRGVPQDQHLHGLLQRGRDVLEELLPGTTAELLERGAIPLDPMAEARFVFHGRRNVRQPSGLQILSMSRTLLESVVRRRVLALPGITPVAPVSGVDLLAGPGRVTGVRMRSPESAEELPAALVVDATGRGSHLPAWLREHGHTAPPEERVEVDVSYRSWTVPRRPADLGGDPVLLITVTPDNRDFGGAMAIEGDRWHVLAGGYHGRVAPADWAGFRRFTEGLAVPDLAELLAGREPLEGPWAYRYSANTRHRYERLRDLPQGLVAVGDAVCSSNPVYGQGMTVAALQALELRAALADGLADVAPRFFRRAARVLDAPWDIAAGSDLQLPFVPGPRPLRSRLVNAYVERASVLAGTDPVLAMTLSRVNQLLDPPQSLLRPAVVARVLRGRRRDDGAGAPVAPVAVPLPRQPEPEESTAPRDPAG